VAMVVVPEEAKGEPEMLERQDWTVCEMREGGWVVFSLEVTEVWACRLYLRLPSWVLSLGPEER